MWCYHCNKDVPGYLDGHLWTKHHTLTNLDPKIEQVKKQDQQLTFRQLIWSLLKGMCFGYTAWNVLFTKPGKWNIFTRVIAVGAGYYGVRQVLGVYDMFPNKKKKKGGKR